MRKGAPDIEKVNKILAGISQDERTRGMDQAIRINLQQQIVMNKQDLFNDFKIFGINMATCFYVVLV